MYLLGEEGAFRYGMCLWILTPNLREHLLSRRPEATRSENNTGVVARFLRRAEILSLANLFPIPVPRPGSDEG